jgi:hypothetical protein
LPDRRSRFKKCLGLSILKTYRKWSRYTFSTPTGENHDTKKSTITAKNTKIPRISTRDLRLWELEILLAVIVSMPSTKTTTRGTPKRDTCKRSKKELKRLEPVMNFWGW